MHEKSKLLVCIIVSNCRFFQITQDELYKDRICPIKLKIGMLYHMNNIFRQAIFYISVPEPLLNQII